MKKRKITKKHLKFAEMLASGATVKEASNETGISLSTGYKWNGDDAIKEAVAQIRRGVLNGIQGRLLSAGRTAVDTLLKLCQDENAPAHVQATSARAILDCLIKVREALDIEDRIQALEEKLKALEGKTA